MPRRLVIVLLFAIALTASASAAGIEPTKREDKFTPKPTGQKRVDKKRANAADTRPAATDAVAVAKVPAAEAKAMRPTAIEMKQAPIVVTPKPEPSRKPAPARITTDAKLPEKFEKKYRTAVAEKYQAGITDAEQIKRTKLTTKQATIEPARINRFVYRRNEPVPATTPAGGDNKPSAGAPATKDSSGS